jgi:hypothetical protein
MEGNTMRGRSDRLRSFVAVPFRWPSITVSVLPHAFRSESIAAAVIAFALAVSGTLTADELPPLPGPGVPLPLDVDGDGVSTFGDQYIFNAWAANGGNWTKALENAVPSDAVLDLSEFFRSPSAALSKDAVIFYPEDGDAAGASEPDAPAHVAWFPGSAEDDPAVAAAFASTLRTDLALADALREFLHTQPGLSARLSLNRVELEVTAAYD